MIHVFVNSSIKIKINQYEPIYNLKEYIQKETGIPIEKQILYHNGFKLDNNKCILDYQIDNYSNIDMTTGLKGGFDTLSFLMWLLYLCAFMIYLLVLVSGLMPIIARSYGYLINWALQTLGDLIGMGQNKFYQSFLYITTFVISIGIVYYFVYASTAFITFPLMYTRYDDVCKSIKISDYIGWWVSIFFMVIYGILNIPDILLNMGIAATKVNKLAQIILSPFLGLLRNFSDEGKFMGFYAIPFIGTPFLSGYDMAVDISSEAVVNGIDFAAMFDCEKDNIALATLLRGKGTTVGTKEWGEVIRNIVREYNAEELAKVIAIGLDPKELETYKCHVDNMPFWEKFGGTATEYYVAKYAAKGFCFALKFIKAISNVLKSFGGSDQIANIIKTGNISGIISFIVFIIVLILGLINWWDL